ncbi:MAG: CxxCxxCC domain-containing protein [Planctomycetota bacterium]|jgi:uncharacterized cysteine cluster protein YcgN (CxxCxxCC family)
MEDRDQLCRRCGRCCYAKIDFEDEVYYTDIPCPYLDTQTNLCTVYEKRFDMNPRCLTAEEGIILGVFPADCPYVRDIEGYRPPHTKDELAEIAGLNGETPQGDEEVTST